MRLNINPTPPSTNTVTVALSVSDNEQLTVSPEEVVFSAASTDLVVSVTDDNDEEGEETYTVQLSLTDDNNPPTRFSAGTLSVTAPESDERVSLTAATAALSDSILAEGDATILTVSLEEILMTTATLTLDYDSELISLSGEEIIFIPGETVSAITVTALNNRLANANTRTASISFNSQEVNISPAPDDVELSIEPDDRAAIVVYPTLLNISEGQTREVALAISPALAQRATITAALSYLDRRQVSVSNEGQVVIPAGETQVMMAVSAVDDNVREGQTDHSIDLRAIGHADLAQDEITIRVPVDNRDFVEDIDGRDDEVAENSPAGAEVGITVEAPGATTYTLTDNAGGLFAIDPQSGTVTVAIDMLDHEAFPFHAITVQALSVISTYTASFAIRVVNVPETLRPVLDIDFNANKIGYGAAQGDTVGITARAVDPDRDSQVSYSLSEDAGGLFAIGQQDGIVSLASDEERPERSHLIEVVATSSDGSTSSAQFTIRKDEPIRISVEPKATTIIEGESQDITFSSVKGNLEAKGISAGFLRSCAITTDNRAVCWGSDSYGSTMPPAGRFIAVSAGERHNCAISADNRAVCWGDNEFGQSAPPEDRKFIAVSAGREHSCGVTASNDAVCWGNDEDRRTMPPAGEKFIALSAGTRYNCGITVSNDATCWGANLFGETAPPSERKFIAISAGSSHSCAVTLDNDAICWGLDFADSTTPPSDRKFIAVSAGDFHSCGITTTSDAVCWGPDFFDVIRPSTDRKLIALSAGYYHTCGITDTNGVVCWGSNEGGSNEGADNEEIGQSMPPQIAPAAAASITATAIVSEMDREQISVSDNGQAVIPTGETQTTLRVSAVADSLKEPQIDYTIDLSVAGPATLDTDRIVVTVVNDDRVSNLIDIDGDAGGEVAENSPDNTTVGITIQANNATTYTLSDDADGRFTISSTGLVTVADGSLLDFEDATSHGITVEARNTGSSRTMQFTIVVTDVNEFDLTQVIDSDPEADQLPRDAMTGSYTGITLSATDADGSAMVTYTLLDSNDGLFLADTNTGIVSLQGSLDYERSIRHTIIAQAMSSDGSAPTTQTFTISLTKQPPVVVGELRDLDGRDNEVAERSPDGSTVGITIRADNATAYTLSDDAEGRFAISSTGLVTVAGGSLLNFEDAATHGITAQASNNVSSQTISLTIAVINANEITLRDRDGRDNFARASTGTVVVGMELEAVHADAAPITAWELQQAVDLFELTQAAGSSTQGLRIKAGAENLRSLIDTTTDLSVIARTEYDVTTEVHTIRFTEQEVILVGELRDADDADNAVAERSPDGSTVGITVRADNATAYTLSDDAGGRFAISSTGLVTVADGSLLNFEDATTHGITAQASNNVSSQTISLTIAVINANEITLRDRDGRDNFARASTGTVVVGMELEAVHADDDVITGWEITAQISSLIAVDLFELTQADNSATQTLRIKAGEDLASITAPITVSLTIRAQTAFDETSEDFDVEVSPSMPTDGIRLRIRVYLEGALE